MRAERSIKYLTEQVEKSKLTELRASLFDLILSKIETTILLNAILEYLFQEIDKVVAPENKSKPKRNLTFIFGIIIGGGLGVLFVVIKNSVVNKHFSNN